MIRPSSRASRQAAVLLLFCCVSTAAGGSEIAVDINRFFVRCERLTNFEKAGGHSVRAVSQTRITDSARLAIRDIVSEWQAAGDSDLRRLAFILATARRESSGTWLPVREAPRCGMDEACRERAIGRLLAERAARRGRPPAANYASPAANGKRYYGRGYIQLTGRGNYALVDRKLASGTRFVDDPDLVMEPSTAAKILVRGMLEGWFGVRKPLSEWLGSDREDWERARDNVNPGSPNKVITAASAKEIYACLR
jgi:Chitinase class I